VRQAIAGAGDEIVEDVIGIERQRLVGIVEDATGGKVVAMKGDGDEAAGEGLGGGRKGLLALVLAEIELGGAVDQDLNDAVGQLPWLQLVEPDPIEGGMLHAHMLEDSLPEGGVQGGHFRRTPRSIAQRAPLSRSHNILSSYQVRVDE